MIANLRHWVDECATTTSASTLGALRIVGRHRSVVPQVAVVIHQTAQIATNLCMITAAEIHAVVVSAQC